LLGGGLITAKFVSEFVLFLTFEWYMSLRSRRNHQESPSWRFQPFLEQFNVKCLCFVLRSIFSLLFQIPTAAILINFAKYEISSEREVATEPAYDFGVRWFESR
jgi:hypothetical protein